MDWSPEEIAAAVADYLDMLELELAGQTFNKSAHRRSLLTRLNNRVPSAVEKRHQNISSVLKELGYPQIVGYKPLPNFRRESLFPEVIRQIDARPVLDELIRRAIQLPAVMPSIDGFRSVKVDAPARATKIKERGAEPFMFEGSKRDYLVQEARNQELGNVGERFVVDYEAWRLTSYGRSDLASEVEHVSKTRGDGLGYDVRSFESDGQPRFIEVKTTAYTALSPFFVSRNELRFASAFSEQFHLYRVFEFRKSPKLFDLPGRIEDHCFLDAVTFSASFE
jgi:Domain of unknown function (DUF3883)